MSDHHRDAIDWPATGSDFTFIIIDDCFICCVFFKVVLGSIDFRIEAFACDGACAAASILEEFAAASGAEFAASGAEFAAARATAVFSEQGVRPV